MANSSISVVWETTSTCSPETQIAATMNVKVGAFKIGPAERIFENHLQRWAMQHHLDPLEEPPLLQASHPHSQKWIKMADANMLVLWFLNSLCDWNKRYIPHHAAKPSNGPTSLCFPPRENVPPGERVGSQRRGGHPSCGSWFIMKAWDDLRFNMAWHHQSTAGKRKHTVHWSYCLK